MGLILVWPAALALGSGPIASGGRAQTQNDAIEDVLPQAPCPTGTFLPVAADPHNAAYPAPHLSVSCSATSMTVASNGIPTFEFVQTTPNALQAASATYHIPLTPTPAARPSPIPYAGPAGVSVAGLPLFGPTEAPRDGYKDPVTNIPLDFCNGHTAQRGEYHHHARPDCLFPTVQKAGLVIGYAFDGYPILAPYECADARCQTVYKVHSSYQYVGGSTVSWKANAYVQGKGNLDACNGMTRPDGTYAYYATDEFPYFMGCYHGVVDGSNLVPQPPL